MHKYMWKSANIHTNILNLFALFIEKYCSIYLFAFAIICVETIVIVIVMVVCGDVVIKIDEMSFITQLELFGWLLEWLIVSTLPNANKQNKKIIINKMSWHY